jgi:hypothetical protein
MAIDFNVAPYFDDFEEAKKFIKILFRPGYPVQTRELNQIQSILQNQLSRLGDSFFKDGEVVIPGEAYVDTLLSYVKVDSVYNAEDVSLYLEDIVGASIVGQTTGVSAKVVAVSQAQGSDPITLFVKYESAGSDTVTKEFVAGEDLFTDDQTISGNIRRFKAQPSEAVGYGSAAFVNRGVYYVNKSFALVESQTIILDKYTSTPSYKVGFDIVESFVTSDDDSSLNDNATGTYNFDAPGAHRYKIELVLTKYALDATTSNFVEVLRIENGILKSTTTNAEYSVLEKTLAERTFDESGDYTVKSFPIQIREHRNNDQGTWESAKQYYRGDIVSVDGATFVAQNSGISGPTEPSGTGFSSDGVIVWEFNETPDYNNGLFVDGDREKLAVGIEPGKAYIKGYKVERIATDYIAIPKARDYSNVNADQIPTNIGSTLLITGITGAPDIAKFAQVNLYDQVGATGSITGTARIRSIEFESGTVGTSGAIYRLGVFDVRMNSGKSFGRDVKSLTHSGSPAFVANVSPIQNSTTEISGSVTVAGSTVTGYGTRFTQELVVGDYLVIQGISYRVATITSDVSLTISGTVTVAEQVVAYLFVATIDSQSDGALLFPVGQNYIRSLRSSDDISIDMLYFVTQKFVATASGGTATIQLSQAIDSTTLGTSFDLSAQKSEFVVINNVSGSIVDPATVVVSDTQVQITGLANVEHTVFAPVFKSGIQAKEKTKTLVQNQTVDFSSLGAVTPSALSLGKADVVFVRSIKMSDSFGAYNDANAVDISDRFTFDNGQTDSFYGVSSLVRKADSPIPSGTVRVNFDYYSHSAGDYFSVNSYPEYAEIPFYFSSLGTIPLRDVLDFRPRMNDAGTAFGGLTQIPKAGNPTIADYSFYLPRRDKISMDMFGTLIHGQGTSSLTPTEPEDATNAMLLYRLSLQPYTVNTQTVAFEMVDNKRYTMRDIGKLEKRIDNLEYYTSLSLLEQETANMEIVDEYGLDRYKNGFIVDQFSGHGIGDAFNPDYRCSVDMENKILRPMVNTESITLVDKYASNTNRAADNYRITGDIITLPYSEVLEVNQPLASRTENINPFAVYTFVGNVSMVPPSDDWFEVSRAPDVVRNVEGNFNAVVSRVGGLTKTVWNAWQTQWSGSTSRVVSRGRLSFETTAVAGDGANRTTEIVRTDTIRTTTTSNQARTGLQTSVVQRIDREFVEDRVISTAVVPFIRSRSVIFLGRKLKPNTRFYATFDDVDVSSYVRLADRFTFTPIVGQSSDFDTESNAGSLSDESARQYNNNPELAFTKGDVVYVRTRGATNYTLGTSPATAIAALQENNVTSNSAIRVVNRKGTFQVGDVIQGSLSGARVTISAINTYAQGEALVSNNNGDVVGTFVIPSDDKLKFRTGSRRFRLSDKQEVGPSVGSGSYRAEGILQTKQATFNAVRNAEVVTRAVTDSRTITSTSTQQNRVVVASFANNLGDGGGDPLAQTFMVENRNGAFLTGVDIFFATKDANIPVTLEIREVVNGYPGQIVLPFSRVTLTPNRVNVNNTNGTTATRFTFASPVYVSGFTEYAIVLLSDSNSYNVWVAQMGEKNVGTDNYITSQPSLGVLFKSQNASTWSADQMQDLKFKVYRASFNTTSPGYVKMINQQLRNVELVFNPFKTTSGSNVVRVFQEGHGLTVGSSVTISNVSGDQNGIPEVELNATHTVTAVTYDAYVIQVTTNASVTGFCGGEGVAATRNIMFDAIQPQVQFMTYVGTSANARIKFTSGKSIGGSEIPYVVSSSYTPVIMNDNNILTAPAVVASAENEPLDGANNPQKTLEMIVEIASDDEYLSPVIDAMRTSAILVNNLVDKASTADNKAGIDIFALVSSNTTIGFTAPNRVYSADSGVMDSFKSLVTGKTVTISGAATGANNGNFVVSKVSPDGAWFEVTASTISTEATGASVTVTTNDFFVSEIASRGSSSASKYITKKIELANASTMMTIRFAASVPPAAELEVWYKLQSEGSNEDFSTINFVRANDSAIVKSSSGEFRDVTIKEENLPAFQAVAIKLVMKSSSSSSVPMVKDLRVIALA